ncbi:MAG TPA: hypothetical protein PKV80_27970 [Leptospiraceae bacterium]|nr:hypothetical protein [Leptospiraceae bacterium]
MKDLAPDWSNLPTFRDTKDPQEKTIPPVGKEDIKIPVEISYNRKPSYEGRAKRVNIAVCDISGCTFPVLISPALSLEFFWRSPLASKKNAVKIASLGKLEMIKIPAEYIAGTILSLLSSANLIEDRLEARERNEILVSVLSDVQLVESAIRILKLIEWEHPERFPKIAFSRLWNAENFLGFLNECEFIKNPPKAQEVEENLKTAILRQEKPKKLYAMPFQNRVKIAVLSKELEELGIISKKAAGLFRWLQIGHNYRNLSAEHKGKYIQYLSDKGNEKCEELALLISQIEVEKPKIDVTETSPSDLVRKEPKEKELTLAEKLELLRLRKGK